MSSQEEIIKSYQLAFGKRVREVRLEKGLSQLDLAVACNLEKTAISRIENGRTNVTLKTMVILSESLDASLVLLMEGLVD